MFEEIHLMLNLQTWKYYEWSCNLIILLTSLLGFFLVHYDLKNILLRLLKNFCLGYYAEQLSSDDIVTKTDNGNSSTSIRTTKTTKKSSHIYKLSYAGPIVMGVGGKYWVNVILTFCI